MQMRPSKLSILTREIMRAWSNGTISICSGWWLFLAKIAIPSKKPLSAKWNA
jgi:hypothetical protein